MSTESTRASWVVRSSSNQQSQPSTLCAGEEATKPTRDENILDPAKLSLAQHRYIDALPRL